MSERRLGYGHWFRLVRFGFRLLYNELAWSYDMVSWLASFGAWRSWQLAAIPYLTGVKVLEVAHGPGHMLVALEDRGFKPIGIDLSPAMSRIAARRLKKANMTIPLVRGDAKSLPFADETIDCVLSTFPSEFIASASTIENLYRILAPGGRLVVVFEARFTGSGVGYQLVEWLYRITGQRVTTLEEDGPSSIWSSTVQLFQNAGFELQYKKTELDSSQVSIVVAIKGESVVSARL